MDLSRIDARLLSRPGATKALHKKWGWMVYWVGGRQFACELTASSSPSCRSACSARSPASYAEKPLGCFYARDGDAGRKLRNRERFG